jgi:hypothetical protein
MIIGWNNGEYPANTGVHFVETHFGFTGWRLIKKIGRAGWILP